MKLPLREGADESVVGEGGDVERAGVLVPEEMAERPELAGVDGGGRGPEGESVVVDQGRALSGAR
jgi:hypothetical protein